jgi:hypothetical protein
VVDRCLVLENRVESHHAAGLKHIMLEAYHAAGLNRIMHVHQWRASLGQLLSDKVYHDFRDNTEGNGYATLWENSTQVAAALVAPGKLEAVVGDITAHHAAVAHPNNPMQGAFGL